MCNTGKGKIPKENVDCRLEEQQQQTLCAVAFLEVLYCLSSWNLSIHWFGGCDWWAEVMVEYQATLRTTIL